MKKKFLAILSAAMMFSVMGAGTPAQHLLKPYRQKAISRLKAAA